MTEIKTTYITISRPMGDGDGGRVEYGHFTVAAGVVTLTDQAGVPVGSGRMQIGYTGKVGSDETPSQTANRLLWRHYRATKSGSDFNRPIVYQNRGIV